MLYVPYQSHQHHDVFHGRVGELISRDVYDDTNIMSRANGPSYDVSPHLRKSVCVITFFFSRILLFL